MEKCCFEGVDDKLLMRDELGGDRRQRWRRFVGGEEGGEQASNK
jgi:hypothetical protein